MLAPRIFDLKMTDDSRLLAVTNIIETCIIATEPLPFQSSMKHGARRYFTQFIVPDEAINHDHKFQFSKITQIYFGISNRK